MGLKAHDYLVILQCLIPAGVRGYLRKHVHEVLHELGEFFKRSMFQDAEHKRYRENGKIHSTDFMQIREDLSTSVFWYYGSLGSPLTYSSENWWINTCSMDVSNWKVSLFIFSLVSIFLDSFKLWAYSIQFLTIFLSNKGILALLKDMSRIELDQKFQLVKDTFQMSA